MVKNNYSSGRNDDRLANPNGKNIPQIFVDPQEEGPHQTDVMPCHQYAAVGNMNLGTMLIENIRSHDYFKGLSEMPTFDEVVDQTYYDCKFCTPWVPGTHRAQKASGMCSGLRGVSNAGTPSTCYMLLFKFFTLQLTKRQVRTLITHADSPYIRCIGFLYLRYVCDPKQLWGWCEPYLHDDEKFSEEGNSTMTTIGEWLRRLLIDQEYHDTMLPRLPVPVAKDHTQKLAELRGGGGSSMSVVGRYEEERDGRGGEERREDARRDERDEPPVNYRDLDQDGYGAPRVVQPKQHAPRREDYDERRRDDYRSHDDRRRDDRRDDDYYDRRDRDRERDRDRGGYGGGGYGGGGYGDRGYGDRGGGRRYDERDREEDYRRKPDHRMNDRDYTAREEDQRRYGSWQSGREDYRPRAGDRPAEREWQPSKYDAPPPPMSFEKKSTMTSPPSMTSPSSSSTAAAAAPDPAAPKVESAAEKLARLRAKQAALAGNNYLTGGKVGGDYASGSSAGAAKGLARYQQLVKDARK